MPQIISRMSIRQKQICTLLYTNNKLAVVESTKRILLYARFLDIPSLFYANKTITCSCKYSKLIEFLISWNAKFERCKSQRTERKMDKYKIKKYKYEKLPSTIKAIPNENGLYENMAFEVYSVKYVCTFR